MRISDWSSDVCSSDLRAFNERLTALAAAPAVEALTAVLLLAPQIPLIFMGEEWGETRPFTFFTDFPGALAAAVPGRRRQEFRKSTVFCDAPIELKGVV